MVIHESAAKGFAAGADAYERGRPSYSPEAIAHIVRELRIGPGKTVLDLAAGTGKLTRQLVPSGAELVAVEPIPEMRAKLAAAVPQAEIRDGTAEAIPAENHSIDAVVVGQAFHWFDGIRALSEIRRVLRPDGGLGPDLAVARRIRAVGRASSTRSSIGRTTAIRASGPRHGARRST